MRTAAGVDVGAGVEVWVEVGPADVEPQSWADVLGASEAGGAAAAAAVLAYDWVGGGEIKRLL